MHHFAVNVSVRKAKMWLTNEIYEQFAILVTLVLTMQYRPPTLEKKNKQKHKANSNPLQQTKRIRFKCHFHLSLF